MGLCSQLADEKPWNQAWPVPPNLTPLLAKLPDLIRRIIVTLTSDVQALDLFILETSRKKSCPQGPSFYLPRPPRSTEGDGSYLASLDACPGVDIKISPVPSMQ